MNFVSRKRGISSSASIAVIVILIIIAAAGWVAYAAFPSTKTLPAQTITTTLSASGACTAPTNLTTVNVGIIAVSGGVSPQYTAQELGFFAQQGLQVKETVVSGAPLTNGLLTNQFNFIITGGASVFPIYAEGKNIVSLVSIFDGTSTGGIVVQSSLYKAGFNVSNLSGMRIGTVQSPSSQYYLTQLLSKYFNVNWTVVTYSSVTTLLAAFQTNQVAAAVALSPGQTLQAVQLGGVMLTNPLDFTPTVWSNILRSIGYPIPSGAFFISAILATSDYMIQQHPDIVQKYVNAFTEGAVWDGQHNVTQIVNLDLKDQAVFAGASASAIALDVDYLKVGEPTNANITTGTWTATSYLALAESPSLSGNETNILNSYNALVNNTFWKGATWCYSSAVW